MRKRANGLPHFRHIDAIELVEDGVGQRVNVDPRGGSDLETVRWLSRSPRTTRVSPFFTVIERSSPALSCDTVTVNCCAVELGVHQFVLAVENLRRIREAFTLDRHGAGSACLRRDFADRRRLCGGVCGALSVSPGAISASNTDFNFRADCWMNMPTSAAMAANPNGLVSETVVAGEKSPPRMARRPPPSSSRRPG